MVSLLRFPYPYWVLVWDVGFKTRSFTFWQSSTKPFTSACSMTGNADPLRKHPERVRFRTFPSSLRASLGHTDMAANESKSGISGGSIYLGVGEDETNSVYKKTKGENVSKLRLSVIIMATACLLAAEGIASFKCIRQSSAIHLNVFFYWVQSCFIALILKLWTRKRARR